jgi:hypothetical protein
MLVSKSIAMLFVRFLLVLACFVGHGAFWVACFNRINATGLDRRLIKKIEKILIAACLVLPLILAAFYGREVWEWCVGSDSAGTLAPRLTESRSLSTVPILYGLVSLLALAILLPMFIAARFEMRQEKSLVQERRSTCYDIASIARGDIYGQSLARRLASLPGNQIGKLEIVRKRMEMPRLPAELNGLSILHLSDLHLTGEMTPEFYRTAFDLALQSLFENQQPDLCILSGDLVDFDPFLSWLPDLLRPINALFGNYFLLGNHDRRLSDPDALRTMMTEMGWQDVGRNGYAIHIAGKRVEIIGNEKPWFAANPDNGGYFDDGDNAAAAGSFGAPDFEIAVAHSPDQFSWAIGENSDLFLAGHTHGGQVRVPVLGPLIAPSWHGSRYASGVFRRRSTTMHVSRGISGVHPLRWNCPPEIATLELRSPWAQPDRMASWRDTPEAGVFHAEN